MRKDLPTRLLDMKIITGAAFEKSSSLWLYRDSLKFYKPYGKAPCGTGTLVACRCTKVAGPAGQRRGGKPLRSDFALPREVQQTTRVPAPRYSP
ncbi:hypothetical protein Y032_0024g1067 [Ancylostoma ceylanicum]|uniref:Uncharacterized protein n=1 Tax=Ancylostoma ceylanicum TaxID=53326 RepID=A0A016UWM3_9BILA|nr:hypothetical protein Y032_0024g1067 [Ancylostoma ceylanicum]